MKEKTVLFLFLMQMYCVQLISHVYTNDHSKELLIRNKCLEDISGDNLKKDIIVIYVHGTYFPKYFFRNARSFVFEKKDPGYLKQRWMKNQSGRSVWSIKPGLFKLNIFDEKKETDIDDEYPDSWHRAREYVLLPFDYIMHSNGVYNNIDYYSFNWNGSYRYEYRIDAAKELEKSIERIIFDPRNKKKEIVLIGFSHGGNVLLQAVSNYFLREASSGLQKSDKINSIVLLGCPIGKKTISNIEEIYHYVGRIFNFYSNVDSFQTMDVFFNNGFFCDRRINSIYKNVYNIEVLYDFNDDLHYKEGMLIKRNMICSINSDNFNTWSVNSFFSNMYYKIKKNIMNYFQKEYIRLYSPNHFNFMSDIVFRKLYSEYPKVDNHIKFYNLAVLVYTALLLKLSECEKIFHDGWLNDSFMVIGAKNVLFFSTSGEKKYHQEVPYFL